MNVFNENKYLTIKKTLLSTDSYCQRFHCAITTCICQSLVESSWQPGYSIRDGHKALSDSSLPDGSTSRPALWPYWADLVGTGRVLREKQWYPSTQQMALWIGPVVLDGIADRPLLLSLCRHNPQHRGAR